MMAFQSRTFKLVLFSVLAAAGCSGARKRLKGEAKHAEVPAPFAVRVSSPSAVVPPPFTVHPGIPDAQYPAVFYVRFQDVLSRYLDSLLKEKALEQAYGGYYRGEGRSLEQLWQSVKRGADRVGQLVSLYPGLSLIPGAYQTVRGAISQGESNIKRELSKEEQMAAQVHNDIHLAIRKVAVESHVQIVQDASGSGLLYVNPAWDLTDKIFDTLIQAKTEEVSKQKEGDAAPAPPSEPPAEQKTSTP